MFALMEDVGFMNQDLAACLLVLANALEAKGALSKREIAAAAQERLLVLQQGFPPETMERLPLLQMLARNLETRPPDA